mgnify:CR=1 FL=1
MKKISKDMRIGDILMIDRGIAAILIQAGMHCVGCPSASGETLQEACAVHNLDADKLIDSINKFLSEA